MSSINTWKKPEQKSSIVETLKRFFDGLWSVFAAIVVVGGLLGVMYFAGGRQIIDWVSARTWEENSCQIDYARVHDYRSGSGVSGTRYYKVDTRFRYEVNGKPYVGKQYDFTLGASNSRGASARAVRFLNSRSSTTCYFNPRKPHQAVIDRGLRVGMLFVLIPTVLLMLFGTMAVGGLFRKIFPKKKRRFLP